MSLLALYQSTSAHLSLIRSVAPGERTVRVPVSHPGPGPDPVHRRTVQPHGRPCRFFVLALPAALYRIWLADACLWGRLRPGRRRLRGLDRHRRRRPCARWPRRLRPRSTSKNDFIDYYSENPAASFAGAVWTNNAWISAQAVALGITGFWVPMILFSNAQGVGVAAGHLCRRRQAGRLLQLHPAARPDGTHRRLHCLCCGAPDLLGHGVAGPAEPGCGPWPRKAGR